MYITVDAKIYLDDYFDTIVTMVADKVKEERYDDKSIQKLQAAMKIPDPPELKISSLPDKMKFEYLCKVWDKYSLEQLETLLPE